MTGIQVRRSISFIVTEYETCSMGAAHGLNLNMLFTLQVSENKAPATQPGLSENLTSYAFGTFKNTITHMNNTSDSTNASPRISAS
jgi:hypothetical protein